MPNLVDRVFSEVCLDERITDGIFRMEEEQHMNALRDYFVRKGIAPEAAIHVTNRMVEGKYPERQAYNRDGILVTFPTPQHKHRALARGTHFEKNPHPQKPAAEPEPEKKPPKEPADRMKSAGLDKEPPKDDEDDEEDKDTGDKKEPTIFQGDKELEVEPPKGEEPIAAPPPQPPSVPQAPRTPERIAAEKDMVQQIMNTDDTVLTNVADLLNVNEAALKIQLHELYKKADELGFREAVTFLTKYVKP